MPGSYIPARDAEARDWYNNFATIVSANVLALGLATGDVTTISGVANNFNTAFLTASNPVTRTSASIAAKNAAKNNASFIIRPYAMRINSNPAVSNSLRQQLGITIRDRNPSRQPAPVTQPLLSVVNATPGEHLVRFADALTPASRRKPVFAISMQLYRAITEDAPAPNPSTAVFVGNFSSNPVRTANNPDDAGRTATYFGRWINRRGEPGPWSAGSSLTVAF